MNDPALNEVLTEVWPACHTEIRRWRADPTPVHSKRTAHGGHEPVTDVDLRVQALLTTGLRAAWPGLPIIAEEDATHPELVPEDCLIVDPIDGTLSLMAGSPAFGIAVCLVRAGRPVQAVVDLSDYRVRLVVTAGGDMHVVGDADRLPRFDSRTVLTSPRQLIQAARLLADHGSAGLTVTAMPTTGVKMTLVALGHAPAAVYLTAGSAGVCPWDYAAPALAVAASGGAVRDDTGRDLARTLPTPITGWCATAVGATLPDLTLLTPAET